MLTALGAKRIIKAVKASCAIVRPIDDFLDRYWQIGNPVFGFFPSPILEHNMQTTIHLPEQIEERQKKQDALKLGHSGTVQMKEARLAVVRDRLERLISERTLMKKEKSLSQKVYGQLSKRDSTNFATG
ncbi:MAG: hypothetical protein EOP20_06100 [Hyphomicrobiales bacterium]|nr:MAG: hypothetical protein EOP20_06100 [Hyphomicrobiales bacterium]